ncbi:MAG: cell division protein SepF [Bacillota bacterium]
MSSKKTKDAYSRTEFIKIDSESDVFALADKLMQRTPLILNFEGFDTVEANRMIIFLSGVIYALDGEVEVIRDKIFVFATKPDLKDKSLRKFINEYKE